MAKAKTKVSKKRDHEYVFDVKLFSSISVQAPTVKEAREQLSKLLAKAVLDLGKKGRKRHTESVDPDGEHELLEIDGEAVDDPEEGLEFGDLDDEDDHD